VPDVPDGSPDVPGTVADGVVLEGCDVAGAVPVWRSFQPETTEHADAATTNAATTPADVTSRITIIVAG
jgi:hypothetical protein